jgi:hypothetical protein
LDNIPNPFFENCDSLTFERPTKAYNTASMTSNKVMIPKSQNTISVSIATSKQFMLYRVNGNVQLPVRFDLINLDGLKVRSIELTYGNEFIIPIEELDGGEYLFAMSASNHLLHTGVINI